MKHLLLLVVLVVVGYALWHGLPAEERNKALKVIARHGFRLGAFLALLLLGVAAAYHLSSSPIL